MTWNGCPATTATPGRRSAPAVPASHKDPPAPLGLVHSQPSPRALDVQRDGVGPPLLDGAQALALLVPVGTGACAQTQQVSARVQQRSRGARLLFSREAASMASSRRAQHGSTPLGSSRAHLCTERCIGAQVPEACSGLQLAVAVWAMAVWRLLAWGHTCTRWPAGDISRTSPDVWPIPSFSMACSTAP